MRVSFLIGAAVLAVVCTQVSGGNDEGSVLRNVRYPVLDENAKTIAEIRGSSATILPGEDIAVSGLDMVLFEDGKQVTTIHAAECVYKRGKGRVESDSDVRVEYECALITGRGFAFNSRESRVEVYNDVKVTLKNIESLAGGLDSGQGPSVSTSEVTVCSGSLVFFRRDKKAVFKDDVVASDGTTVIKADRLVVFFGDENTAESIKADGNVLVERPGETATSDALAAEIKSKELVLTGSAEIRRGDELLRGAKIDILDAYDRIISSPAYLRIVPGEGKRK